MRVAQVEMRTLGPHLQFLREKLAPDPPDRTLRAPLDGARESFGVLEAGVALHAPLKMCSH